MSVEQLLQATVDYSRADEVGFVEGNLTVTRPEGSEKLHLEETLFVLQLPAAVDSSAGFLICSLQEAADDGERPFRLSCVSTPKIPHNELERYLIHELPSHLHHGGDNNVDIIVSTKSGMNLASTVWDTVLKPLWQLVAVNLRERPILDAIDQQTGKPKPDYRVLLTETAESIRDFARGSSGPGKQDNSRTIVLLSGDGGVVDLLNGWAEGSSNAKPPVLALLPLGTGNALFHSMHKSLYSDPGPTPLVLALRTLFLGTAADLPTFRASFSSGSRIVTFADKSKADKPDGELHLKKEETSVSHLDGAIVASYGFHASIVYESDTPEYRVHGDKRFGMVAQELLRESHPYAAKVEIRRSGSCKFETIPRETHAYVLTTLVSNLERKFTISPESKPLENRLHLVHFGPIGGERIMDAMMKAYDGGKHVGMKWDDGEEIGYEEIDEVKVEVLEEDERWRKVCIDGTIVEIPKGGQMSVKVREKGPFKVLVDPSVLQP
ncbi:Fc.00g090080.m01.CDS01 [Cosmosporella sp. VM-42]